MAFHVLIAEDEEVTREAVRDNLRELLPGAVVHAVKNGMEAVAYATEHKIKVAFLDIRMPEMNGIAAAQRIRKMQEECELVFLTAYDDFEYVRSALKLDAVDYLLKPFDWETLTDVVQKVMERIGDKGEWLAEHAVLKFYEQEERSRWIEEKDVKALLSGHLSPELIPAGSCGCIAALTGMDESQMQRLRHMLTGLDMGMEIRCLIGKAGNNFVLAIWSMSGETLQEQVKRQMDRLVAGVGRQFGITLSCGISGVFLNDWDIPEACLDAFGQMELCTSQNPVRALADAIQGDAFQSERRTER